LITNIDNFTVGFFLGSTALGLYAVAYVIGYTPVALLSSPAGSALFPSLAKIQLREEALRQGYLESFGYAAVFIAPAAFGMAMMAPEIVRVLLGPIWIGATVPLLVLAFYGLARAFLDFGSSLFAAVGKPRIIAILNLYVLVGSAILVFPLTIAYGISGTALAMTIPVGVVAVVSISRAAKVLRADVRRFVGKLRCPLLAAAAMGVPVWVLRVSLYATLPDRVSLPLVGRSVSEAAVVLAAGIPFGLLVYLALLWVLDPMAFQGIWRHARMVLRPRTT